MPGWRRMIVAVGLALAFASCAGRLPIACMPAAMYLMRRRGR